jgi:predicted RNase H-like HicB family nuclease
MLTDFIEAAMRQARYEIMEDGRFWGDIPPCRGVWADGATLEETRRELRGVLESWLLITFQFGDAIPVIDGIDLNARGPRTKAAVTARRNAAAKATAPRRAVAHV